jgi:hypothetical protein
MRLRGFGQGEEGGGGVQQLGLAGGLGQFAFQGLARVGFGVGDDGGFFAALRDGDFDTLSAAEAVGLDGQGFGDQGLFRQRVVEQDHRGRRLVVVELGDEGGEHLGRVLGLGVGGEEGAVAVVAAAADEEHLDAGLAGDLPGGDHVGIGQAGGVDDVGALDAGERADAVADGRRTLEFQGLGGGFHLRGQGLLHAAGFSGEEGFGLVDQGGVVLRADAFDAGGGAALDLVQQAGAGAVLEHRVAAGAQQEHALHGRHGLVDRPGAGEGAVIAALAHARAAVLGDLGVGVILGQDQPGIGFVVAQDDVVARLQALDEVGFEEKGLRLRMRGDDLHGHGLVDHAAQAFGQAGELGVAGDALAQGAGLADVQRVAVGGQHAIDARGEGHGFQRPFDDADAALGLGWLAHAAKV